MTNSHSPSYSSISELIKDNGKEKSIDMYDSQYYLNSSKKETISSLKGLKINYKIYYQNNPQEYYSLHFDKLSDDLTLTIVIDKNQDSENFDEYTLEGTLLGHITQGIKEIEVIGKEVNADSKIIMLLQHMVLSHHYEPEYGSPVKPLIPEAEMLHYLDVMDARMYDMKKAIKETKENEFSERIWSLDSRRIYNHGMHEKNN